MNEVISARQLSDVQCDLIDLAENDKNPLAIAIRRIALNANSEFRVTPFYDARGNCYKVLIVDNADD